MQGVRKLMNSSQISMIEVKLLHDNFWAWYKTVRKVPWALRSPNMPEILTEAIVCLCTKSQLITSGHGDILRPDGLIGEVKATSSSTRDVSSFSPKSNFDNLYFVHMDKGSTDVSLVYDLHMDRKEVEKIKVNKNETFAQQAEDGRRPRFSILSSIISAKKLKPTWKVDMNTQKIVELS